MVRAWHLLVFGEATKVTTRSSVAHHAHDRELRLAAKRALKYPEVVFDAAQIQSIAHGFTTAIKDGGYVCLACSIMPQHVHVVIRRHERLVERMVAHLKSAATRQMRIDGAHPMRKLGGEADRLPSPWAEGQWKVFIDDQSHLRNAIDYVNDNPAKAGLPRQTWAFVTNG